MLFGRGSGSFLTGKHIRGSCILMKKINLFHGEFGRFFRQGFGSASHTTLMGTFTFHKANSCCLLCSW
jgi:hypothetical protein